MSTAPTPSPTPEQPPRASQEVERERYVALRAEAEPQGDELNTDLHVLESIRRQDTNPAEEPLRRNGQRDINVIIDFQRDVGLLMQVAAQHIRATATPPPGSPMPDDIPDSFWTTSFPALGNRTGEEFVRQQLTGMDGDIDSMVASRFWVRGTDRSVPDRFEELIQRVRISLNGDRVLCGVSGLQQLYQELGGTRRIMGTAFAAAQGTHNERHAPPAHLQDDYRQWRGTDDPEASADIGVLRHLMAVEGHRFWNLEHEGTGQPTIASRAAELRQRITRSILLIRQAGPPPQRVEVQNMEEVFNALRELTDAMGVVLARTRKPDELRVDRGTDAHERGVNRRTVYNRLLIGGSAVLAVLLALTGKAVYDTISGDKADKDGTKEVQPRESAPKKLAADVWVLLRGERTLVFDLPKDIAVDTIRDRYQFFLKPRMGGVQRQVIPLRTDKGWIIQLADEEVIAGGVLISAHENIDGTWKTASENTLIATLEPEAKKDTKPEDQERVADLSPECRVTIKGGSITVRLPTGITPANIEKKFAFFIAKEGDIPPGRYVPLTQGADGWAGSLTADELAKGEVTLTIWDDSTGRVLPRGAPAKVKLK